VKLQFHSLISKAEFSPNLGIAYLHQYRTFAVALVAFSITICWDKSLK
jgi:hypothetical protein